LRPPNGTAARDVHGHDAVVVVDADEWDRIKKPVTGRDIVEALANSPLRDVPSSACQ